MPIYEYVCEACLGKFERLVGAGEQVICPECRSDTVSKQYSRFGMSGGSGRGKYESLPLYNGGGGCCCSPGSCGCKN